MVRYGSLKKQSVLSLFLFCFLALTTHQALSEPLAANIPNQVFLLRFIDAENGRPIPLVEIELFNALRLTSDNLGNIAIVEPDLAGKKVRILIRGNGYRFPDLDFFGERATTIELNPGHSATIKLERQSIAQCLYRITGSGRYRDSFLAGQTVAPEFLKLPGNVTGLDSAVPVVFNNRLYSFYGDTLGTSRLNFSGSGAEIDLASPDVPEKCLPLRFFTDEDGFTRRMFTVPDPGFIWVEAVIPVTTAGSSKEVLAARYVKHKTLEEADETGFAVFNQRLGAFSLIKRIKSSRHHKSAHACPVEYAGNTGYCLQPWERVSDNLASFIKPETYEYYTCLQKAGQKSANQESINLHGINYEIKRNQKGQPVFSWQRGGEPFTPALQQELQKRGLIKNSERWLKLTEIGSGKQIDHFSGSISWNSFRNRWIMITQGNTGEIWYSEADTFTGPWVYARKILEHDTSNFYNPVQHSWFDTDHGRTIYFEGTYTAFFTAKEHKNPRCDYNQVMYKLDLTDPGLALPAPVYRVKNGGNGFRLMTRDDIAAKNLWNSIENIEFMAFSDNSQISDLVPVFDNACAESHAPVMDLIPVKAEQKPVYYALPNDISMVAKSGFASQLLLKGPGTCFTARNACLTLDPSINNHNRRILPKTGN